MDEFSLFEDNVNGGGVLAAGRHYLQEATLSPSTLFPSFSPAPTASMSPTALGNIGPGLGMVGPVDNFAQIPYLGKWLLVWCMLLGRLEIYTVIILLVPEFWRK